MEEIDKFEPRRLTKKQLYFEIENIARESGCKISKIEKAGNTPFVPYSVETNDGTQLTVHIYAKNISSAGWSDNPEIKRIQIHKRPEIPRQKRDEFYFLCGVCKYNQDIILAVWDPLNYTTHNTSCSCYVFVSSMEKAAQNGLFFGLNKGKEVMTCNKSSFSELLLEISSRYY